MSTLTSPTNSVINGGDPAKTNSAALAFQPQNTISVHDGENWVPYIPHYFNGTSWVACIPYVYQNDSWVECSNG